MMKLSVPFCGALAAVLLTGCSTAIIETGEWKATIRSHWFKREFDSLEINRKADGEYSCSLNNYKTDTSERLPESIREMWSGLAILGRIAGATVNPATASVPLTSEAANADEIAKLVKANAEAKAELQKAKAELAAAKAAAAASASSTTAATTAETITP